MKRKFAVLTSGWSFDFVVSLIGGMESVCNENNACLFVFNCYKFVEPSGTENITSFSVFDLINFKDYDGIVITPGLFNDDEMVKKYVSKIKESHVPAVSISVPIDGLHFVQSDSRESIKELILHMINDHSVRTYGFINGPKKNFESETDLKLIRETFGTAGFDYKQSEFFLDYTDWTYNNAYEQVLKRFKHKKQMPDLIIGINHSVAMAAAKAAVQNGYTIPDDIKIIGFDDNSLATKIVPSLTTLNTNPRELGIQAIKILLENPKEITSKSISSMICKRQSCGCEKKITPEQIIYSQGYVKELDKEQRFSSQLRFLEDRFLKNNSIDELCKDLQQYFETRHYFEGPDFAILLDKEVITNISEAVTDIPLHTCYSDKMQTIANIENGKSASQYEITTTDILPPNMQKAKTGTFLILPIFNQKNIYGYYVSKNSLRLLLNKDAYNWTRNLGTIVEKYRQTSVYRRMSEQLRILSTQDSLSGLLNRSGLESYGMELFEMNNKNGMDTLIIFVDVNDMKIINDRFGHLQGDLAIKTVAEAIKCSVPEDFVCVRYGGDEFVIIGQPEDGTDYCTEIRNMLEEKTQQMTLPYMLTASLGSKVFIPYEYEKLSEAINEVDGIMYKEKLRFHKNNK